MKILFFPSSLDPLDRVKSALEFANSKTGLKVYYKIASVTAHVKSGDTLFQAYNNVLDCLDNKTEKDSCLICKK
jgi:hypothetical protein